MEFDHFQNKQDHEYLGNIEFICSSAENLEFPPNNFDFIFSNWLLMYLSDSEVVKMKDKYLEWLTDGGFVFFRESCFTSISGLSNSNNETSNDSYYPAHYRNP